MHSIKMVLNISTADGHITTSTNCYVLRWPSNYHKMQTYMQLILSMNNASTGVYVYTCSVTKQERTFYNLLHTVCMYLCIRSYMKDQILSEAKKLASIS